MVELESELRWDKRTNQCGCPCPLTFLVILFDWAFSLCWGLLLFYMGQWCVFGTFGLFGAILPEHVVGLVFFMGLSSSLFWSYLEEKDYFRGKPWWFFVVLWSGGFVLAGVACTLGLMLRIIWPLVAYRGVHNIRCSMSMWWFIPFLVKVIDGYISGRDLLSTPIQIIFTVIGLGFPIWDVALMKLYSGGTLVDMLLMRGPFCMNAGSDNRKHEVMRDSYFWA